MEKKTFLKTKEIQQLFAEELKSGKVIVVERQERQRTVNGTTINVGDIVLAQRSGENALALLHSNVSSNIRRMVAFGVDENAPVYKLKEGDAVEGVTLRRVQFSMMNKDGTINKNAVRSDNGELRNPLTINNKIAVDDNGVPVYQDLQLAFEGIDDKLIWSSNGKTITPEEFTGYVKKHKSAAPIEGERNVKLDA